MTSSKANHLQKAPFPNTTTLEHKTPTCEFKKDTFSPLPSINFSQFVLHNTVHGITQETTMFSLFPLATLFLQFLN